jgi:hypothetical protein
MKINQRKVFRVCVSSYTLIPYCLASASNILPRPCLEPPASAYALTRLVLVNLASVS